MAQLTATLLQRIQKNDPTLSSLDLRNNSIGDAGATDLANALRVNTTLNSLDLGWNNIGAAGAKDLANALRVNKTLNSLVLSFNNIGAAGAKDLANALRVNKTLNSLVLRNNSIGAAGATDLANALRVNKTLSSLVLCFNNIGAAGAKDLANALRVNKTLNSLVLSFNNIGAAGAKDLANALRRNTTLNSLDLGSNNIGAAGAKDLANALRRNTTLSSLVLRGNKIGAAGAKDLANALRRNTTLNSLDLGSNNIGAAGAKDLANALRRNTTLNSLDLGSNNIGAAGAKDLANALRENTTLTQITLSGNKISREILDLIGKRLARNRERAKQRANQPAVTPKTHIEPELITAKEKKEDEVKGETPPLLFDESLTVQQVKECPPAVFLTSVTAHNPNQENGLNQIAFFTTKPKVFVAVVEKLVTLSKTNRGLFNQLANEPDPLGWSAIHTAARYQTEELAFETFISHVEPAALIKPIPSGDTQGFTAVHFAMRLQSLTNCLTLLDKLDAQTLQQVLKMSTPRERHTPLSLALKYQPINLIERLLDNIDPTWVADYYPSDDSIFKYTADNTKLTPSQKKQIQRRLQVLFKPATQETLPPTTDSRETNLLDNRQTASTPSASSLFETNLSSSESTISLPKLQAHLEKLEQTQKELQQQLQEHQQNAEETQTLKARLAQTQIDQADARYRIYALEAEQADARAAKREIKKIKANPTYNAFYAMVKEHFRCWAHSVEAAEGDFVTKASPDSIWSRRMQNWSKHVQKAQSVLPKLQQFMQNAPNQAPASAPKEIIQKITNAFLVHAPGVLQQAGKALPVAGLALQGLGALLQTYNQAEQTHCIQRSLCFLGTLTYPELFFEQLARRLTLAQIATLDQLSKTPPPVKDNNIKRKIATAIQWLSKKLGKVPLPPVQQFAQAQSLQLLTHIFDDKLDYNPQHSQEQLLDICLRALSVEQSPAPAAASVSPSTQASGNVSPPPLPAAPVMVASQRELSPTAAILHTPASQPDVNVAKLEQTVAQQQKALVQLNSRLTSLSKRVATTSPPEDNTKDIEHPVNGQVVVFEASEISEQASHNRTGQANAASHHPQLDNTIALLINRVLTLEEAFKSAGHHIPQETPPVRTLPDDLRSPEAERAVAAMRFPRSQHSLESTDDDLTPGANLPIQKKSAAQIGQQVTARIITPYQQRHLLTDKQSLPAKTFRFLFKRTGQARLQELQKLNQNMRDPSKANSDASLRELVQLLWQILQSSSKKMKPLVMDFLVELCDLVVEGLNENQQICEIESALTQAGLLSNPSA
jgi:Ran GTPase-activating protein (RanGAP) involved in mRNA processing and transport